MNKAFSWPVRVYYEDTDAGGVVYYANYLKFLERARTEMLRSLGFEQDELRRDGILFVVRHVDIDYLYPARFNQLLDVNCKVDDASKVKIRFAQQIQHKDRLLCAAMVTVACVDAVEFKPRRIPDDIKKEIIRVS
ncbi:MAG: tol-pal system-associated acyl-CoA thioesterase [Thiotrichales bacterium]